MPKENTRRCDCLRTFLRNISVGRVETGLYFNQEYVYTSQCTGAVSVLLIAWLLFMGVTTFQETFQKNFLDSMMDQGPFDISEETVSGYLSQLKPIVQLSTEDQFFCTSHDIIGGFVNGEQESSLVVYCQEVDTSTAIWTYNITLGT